LLLKCFIIKEKGEKNMTSLFSKEKHEETKKSFSLFNFKTGYRATWLSYAALTGFVEPKLIYLLSGYALVRTSIRLGRGFHAHTFSYSSWVKQKYGKADKELTFRKLLYIMNLYEKMNLREHWVRRDINGDFENGKIAINSKIDLTMKKEEDVVNSYHAKLFYKGQVIEKSVGGIGSKVKWDLSDFPDIEKDLHQFLSQVEEAFSKNMNNKKKQKEEDLQKESEEEQRKRKELAEFVHKDYHQM